MNEIKLIVRPFAMGTEKEAADKVLEEASEAREAAQQVRECNYRHDKRCVWCDWKDRKNVPQTCKYWNLADEIADTIQASCNLAARYGIDLQAAMERCEQRNRERGRYEDEDAKSCGIHDGDNRGCGGSCGAVPVGMDVLREKSPEEMSAAELGEMLSITFLTDSTCINTLGEEWCMAHDEYSCSSCREHLLNMLKAAHEREVASLEYEKSYYKEKVEAYERDYDDVMRRITDLAHERDGLRNRLAELSDAGITSLHRLLRETLGEAKSVTDNARVYIDRQQGGKDEHCGSRGSDRRDHGGDCGVQCAREHLLPAEPPAQEMSEREAVIERLRKLRSTHILLHDIGCAVLGKKPTPVWKIENSVALRDKLIELLNNGE